MKNYALWDINKNLNLPAGRDTGIYEVFEVIMEKDMHEVMISIDDKIIMPNAL